MSADISGGVDAMSGLAAPHSLHSDEIDDKFLIAALASGAVWAMDLLYQRYSVLLYSLAYRMVADRWVAEDLLQEVFLAIWQRALTYAPQSGSVSSWLTSIMRHRAIDHLRRTHRRYTLKEIPLEADGQDQKIVSPDVWDEAWRSVQSSLVRECLMRLRPEQRDVIELAYFEGQTQPEIARAYQIPLGTVKARMRLGLRHLKRELEKRGMGAL